MLVRDDALLELGWGDVVNQSNRDARTRLAQAATGAHPDLRATALRGLAEAARSDGGL